MSATSTREARVLQYLAATENSTVDEFLAAYPHLYVNSWAPVFTGLLKRGLIRRTGEQRPTRYGAKAFVLERA